MKRLTQLLTNFVHGAASVLDIGGTLIAYNQSDIPEEADARAIANDWATVGKDMQSSIETIIKGQR